MRHRHINARRGEWVHIHRPHDRSGKTPEWVRGVIGLVILVAIIKGCCG